MCPYYSPTTLAHICNHEKVIVTTLVQDELNQVSYYFIYHVMSGILYFTIIPLLSGNVAKRLIIICLLIRLIKFSLSDCPDIVYRNYIGSCFFNFGIHVSHFRWIILSLCWQQRKSRDCLLIQNFGSCFQQKMPKIGNFYTYCCTK